MTELHRDLLATLEAEREILRTYLHFYRLADTQDCERFVECFTPDALIEYRIMPGPVVRFRGRDEFTEHMTRTPRAQRGRVAHVAGQTSIDWSGERPVLTGYATVWHWYTAAGAPDDNRPADWTTIGLVTDEFDKHDGRWLIARRDVRPVAGRVATGRG